MTNNNSNFDFQKLTDPMTKITQAANDAAYLKGVISSAEATIAVLAVYELRDKDTALTLVKDFLAHRLKEEHEKLKDVRFTTELMMNRILSTVKESGDSELIAKVEAVFNETGAKFHD